MYYSICESFNVRKLVDKKEKLLLSYMILKNTSESDKYHLHVFKLHRNCKCKVMDSKKCIKDELFEQISLKIPIYSCGVYNNKILKNPFIWIFSENEKDIMILFEYCKKIISVLREHNIKNKVRDWTELIIVNHKEKLIQYQPIGTHPDGEQIRAGFSSNVNIPPNTWILGNIQKRDRVYNFNAIGGKREIKYDFTKNDFVIEKKKIALLRELWEESGIELTPRLFEYGLMLAKNKQHKTVYKRSYAKIFIWQLPPIKELSFKYTNEDDPVNYRVIVDIVDI